LVHVRMTSESPQTRTRYVAVAVSPTGLAPEASVG